MAAPLDVSDNGDDPVPRLVAPKRKPVLSFPAHGPKRAYVALCALYPVCAELFLPYESSADRRPAKPKPLAYYVESLQGQRNRQEYSIFCFTPSSSSPTDPAGLSPS